MQISKIIDTSPFLLRFGDTVGPSDVLPMPKENTGHAESPFWTRISAVGEGVVFGTGIFSLLIPLINKKPLPITNIIDKSVSLFLKKPPSPEKHQRFQAYLASREALSNLVKRIISAALFILGISAYQTAVNSRQPSLLANALAKDILNNYTHYPKDLLVFAFTLQCRFL